MKSEVIDAQSAKDLQGAMNEFFKAHPNIVLEEIKFDVDQQLAMVPKALNFGTKSEVTPTAFRLFSVVIIYRDE